MLQNLVLIISLRSQRHADTKWSRDARFRGRKRVINTPARVGTTGVFHWEQHRKTVHLQRPASPNISISLYREAFTCNKHAISIYDQGKKKKKI